MEKELKAERAQKALLNNYARTLENFIKTMSVGQAAEIVTPDSKVDFEPFLEKTKSFIKD